MEFCQPCFVVVAGESIKSHQAESVVTERDLFDDFVGVNGAEVCGGWCQRLGDDGFTANINGCGVWRCSGGTGREQADRHDTGQAELKGAMGG
jgi:hypothetical protein